MKFLNIRILIKWHRGIGLLLGLNLIILNLTGAVLIWKSELEHIGNAKEIAPSSNSLSINVKRAIELLGVEESYKDKKILSIFPDDKNSNWLNLRISQKENQKFRGATKLVYLIKEDELVKNEELKTKSSNILTFILDLHKEILLGSKGKYLNAIVGLLIIFLIISGIIFAQKTKYSRPNNVRIKLGQLHKKVGVYTSLWFFAIVLSGIFLSLNSTVLTLYFKSKITSSQESEVKFRDNSYSAEEISKMIDVVLEKNQNYEIDYISFPGNEFSLPNKFVLIAQEKEKINASKKLVFVDSVKQIPDRTINLPIILEALVFSEVIHFGGFAGIFSKVLWTVMSLVTSVIPVTGIIIFYLRKNKKKKVFREVFVESL